MTVTRRDRERRMCMYRCRRHTATYKAKGVCSERIECTAKQRIRRWRLILKGIRYSVSGSTEPIKLFLVSTEILRCRGVMMLALQQCVYVFCLIAHNRVIRPCHPSHSMPLALIPSKGDQ